MKRISLLTAVILASTPLLAQARSYFPLRYRTRWSTYASGLVSGDVYYSPYAFGIGHNGLIPGNVRYTPYAFGVKKSGLVVDPWWPYGFSHLCSVHYPTSRTSDTPGCCTCNKSQPAYSTNDYSSLEKMKNSAMEDFIARRDRIELQKQTLKKRKAARAKDARQIIYTYLKNKNLGDINTYGVFRINNKTVNVSFILEDKNLIVTYWDIEEVESLIKQSECKKRYYQRHAQTWRNFCENFIKTGGKVFPITSANKEEILAELTRCSELNES